MTGIIPKDRARTFSLVALLIFAVSRIIYSGPFLFILAPILIVILFEKRNLRSLGFRWGPKRINVLLGYAILGFLSQLLILWTSVSLRKALFLEGISLSFPDDMLEEFIGQLFFVGVPEEIYYRGYLMTRLGDWLGERTGWYLSALIFGIAHIWSRFNSYGMAYAGPALIIGLSTFIGALIFGYMLMRTKSLYPPIVAHIATNMFAGGIVAVVI